MNTELFSIGGFVLTPQKLLTVALILILTILVSMIFQRALKKILSRTSESAPGLLASTQRLVHYVTMTIGLIVALETIGFELQTLFAAGALLAIAIGFAMQNLTQNFVSGVILLTERSIKPGDVLEVEGTVVKVSKMGLRSTIARTREETEMIIPNSTLVQTTVKNYTFRDNVFRLRARVGISYQSDVTRAIRLLQENAHDLEWRNMKYDPRVLLIEFSDSSIVLELSVWISDPWLSRFHYSDLRIHIWQTLKDHDITIAFPQLDVHFDKLA